MQRALEHLRKYLRIYSEFSFDEDSEYLIKNTGSSLKDNSDQKHQKSLVLGLSEKLENLKS